MERFRRLWRIELIRHSAVAFLVSAVRSTVVVVSAFALDQVERFRRLWRIDLVRHSAIAFLVGAMLSTAVAVSAFALDQGSGGDLAYHGLSESPSENDAGNRSAAFTWGTRQGRLLGRMQAEQALEELLAGRSERSGYQAGYRQGWNLLILDSSNEAILQLRSAADGTQWIELLK